MLCQLSYCPSGTGVRAEPRIASQGWGTPAGRAAARSGERKGVYPASGTLLSGKRDAAIRQAGCCYPASGSERAAGARDQQGRGRSSGDRGATDGARVGEPATGEQGAPGAFFGRIRRARRGSRRAARGSARRTGCGAGRASAAGGGSAASSAWHRRHVSMWMAASLSARRSPSTIPGSSVVTSSHRMSLGSFVVQHVA